MGRKNGKAIKKIITYAAILLLAVIWLLPLYWLLRSSFMGMEEMFQNPPIWIPKKWRFENYTDALTALPFVKYFINTITIVICSVIGILISCSLSAYGLTRVKWKYRDLVFTILMSTMILPYFTTLIPNFIMWKKLGLVNTFVPMIVRTGFCMGIASVYGGGMFNIFLLRQFIRTIPKELDEAAYVDGAGHFAVFSRIILPLSKPSLTCVGLFTFLNSWNDLINPLIYLNSDKKYTIQLGLRTFIGYFNAEWHLMMAAACAAIIPVVIVFVLGQRYFVEGIATTGLKG